MHSRNFARDKELYQLRLRKRMKKLYQMDEGSPWYLILTTPLRMIQFICSLSMVILLIYLMNMPQPQLHNLNGFLVLILTTTYIFFGSIQIISFFSATDLPEYPMVFGNFMGAFFFTFAGCIIIWSERIRNSWVRVTLFVLCFIVSFLHLVDVLMCLAFWRHKMIILSSQHEINWDIYDESPGSPPYHPHLHGHNYHPRIDACKCKNTSHGAHTIFDQHEDTVIDTTRKIVMCPRMQYVDAGLSAAKLPISSVGQSQTIIRDEIMSSEVQTAKIEMIDCPVQTDKRCELCRRQLDESSRMIPETLAPPIASSSRLHSPVKAMSVKYSPGPSKIMTSRTSLMTHSMNYSPGEVPKQCCGACNCAASTPSKKQLIPGNASSRIETFKEANVSQVERLPTTLANESVPIYQKKPLNSTGSSARDFSTLISLKNKRTQTKSRKREVSEESSDERDERLPSSYKRKNKITPEGMEKRSVFNQIVAENVEKRSPDLQNDVETPKKEIEVMNIDFISLNKHLPIAKIQSSSSPRICRPQMTDSTAVRPNDRIQSVEWPLVESKSRLKPLYRGHTLMPLLEDNPTIISTTKSREEDATVLKKSRHVTNPTSLISRINYTSRKIGEMSKFSSESSGDIGQNVKLTDEMINQKTSTINRGNRDNLELEGVK